MTLRFLKFGPRSCALRRGPNATGRGRLVAGQPSGGGVFLACDASCYEYRAIKRTMFTTREAMRCRGSRSGAPCAVAAPVFGRHDPAPAHDGRTCHLQMEERGVEQVACGAKSDGARRLQRVVSVRYA